MGAPAPVTETPYSSLSEEQVIELLPASDEERYLAPVTPEELELFKSGPRQHRDREGFVREVLSDAYLAFLRRIRKCDAQGQKYENFRGYVYALFISVARDKARQITKKRRPVGLDDNATNKPAAPEQLDDETAVVSKDMTPEQEATLGQLKSIIRSIIDDHAGEHPESAKTLCARSMDGGNWEDVANQVFPPNFFNKSLEARKGRVRRLFVDDCVAIAPKFERAGITSEHVFHFKERGSASGIKS